MPQERCPEETCHESYQQTDAHPERIVLSWIFFLHSRNSLLESELLHFVV